MKAYKGFDKNLKCRRYFQFEVGSEYEENEAKLCNYGFHACKNPLDTLRYYSPYHDSRYCEVELDELSNQEDIDSKICGKRIKIKAEIGLTGIIKAGIKFLNELNKGNCSTSINTINYSISTNNSNYSTSTNTGNYSISTNTGDYSISTNTGDYSISTNTGIKSISNNTGYGSVSINTGDYSLASVENFDSVALISGNKSKVKACKGSAICIIERDDEGKLIAIKSAIVDGEILKPDTYYMLVNGEFEEVHENL